MGKSWQQRQKKESAQGRLWKSAKAGQASGVWEALRDGADPGARDPETGLVALMMAAGSKSAGAPRCVELLRDLTPHGLWSGAGKEEVDPFLLACKARSLPCAELLAPGADLCRRMRNGMGPLEYCSSKGYLELVEFLAPLVPEAQRRLGFLSAAAHGKIECCKALAKFCSANFAGAGGKTPLMMAADSGNAELVEFLLPDSIADARDESGRSALDFARAAGSGACAALLEKAALGGDGQMPKEGCPAPSRRI